MSGNTTDTRPNEASSHKFSITTRTLQEHGVSMPVSGATEAVAARGVHGNIELFTIGSDGVLNRFFRDSDDSLVRQRLPFRAERLAAVPQVAGPDRVYFTEMSRRSRGKKRTLLIYEIVLRDDGTVSRRRAGRMTTVDPQVYGVSPLTGISCRDGSDALLTSFAAHPPSDASSFALIFRRGRGFGLLSMSETGGIAASRVEAAPGDPLTVRWPFLPLFMLYEGRLRVEWGVHHGALVQSLPLELPELRSVNGDRELIDFSLTRAADGNLRLFVLDADHSVYMLSQVSGVASEPPVWADSWVRVDTAIAGLRPKLRRLHAVRHNGRLMLFALDAGDRLYSLTEEDSGWQEPNRIATGVGHLAAREGENGRVELFAITRQDQLIWLRPNRAGRTEGSRKRLIAWQVDDQDRSLMTVYRTSLTIMNDDEGHVRNAPVSITADDAVTAVVNGQSYKLGPNQPIVARTNSFGLINVLFETQEGTKVPSLHFSADFLEGGTLDVSPQRKAQVFVAANPQTALPQQGTEATTGKATGQPTGQIHLIPEDTLLETPPPLPCDDETVASGIFDSWPPTPSSSSGEMTPPH